jgi:acetylornithine deacetylase/succinyl-diaminopimelate desuccinylase-like protein
MRSWACGRLLDDARRFRPRRQLEDAPLIDPGVPGEGWERVEREALALFRVRADFGLGEVGGFSLHVDGRVFHPVMVAQKGVCWFRMRARGEQTREDLLREVRAVVGPDIELEPFYERSAIEMPVETPLFEEIATAVAEMDAAARVVPVLMPGFTDAYAFSRLGCTFHGFVPLRLPPGVPFADLFHGEDERIPVDGFLWGLRVLYRIVRGFCT